MADAGAVRKKPGMRSAGDRIVLETEHLAYVVGTNGLIAGFQDRRSGQDYLDTTAAAPFMFVHKDGKAIASTAVELAQGFLYVTFGDSGIVAKIHVRTFAKYLTLELTAVNDRSITSLQLARLPLTLTKYVTHSLTCCRDDEYAAAVIPANLETHVETDSIGTGKPLLTAFADAAIRLEGAKIAVLGCPTSAFLDIIEQVEMENGLPHPTLGGVWARKSPEVQKSYLFVNISEDTADAMIAYAQAGGFGYIVVYDGTWNSTHGTVYRVNRKYFPNGDAGFKAVSDKIHAAGLKLGMHILNMNVDKTDPAVGPVPDPGLLALPHRRRTLAADIGPDETFIPTTTSPAGLLAKGEKSVFEGTDLRIDNEIIVYDDIQTTAPYGFKDCRRGANGTAVAAHGAGAAIDNYVEFIDVFYHADVGSDLYDRVARANAEFLDKFEFDFIYPENVALSVGEPWRPLWYSNNLLLGKLFHYTKREVMFCHPIGSNIGWHIFSRGNTVDFVHAGIMEHFDRSSLLPALAEGARDLQPFEFGWFGYFKSSPGGDASRPREMEYAWCKALAYGAAMSLETKKAALDANGRTREIFTLLRNWEELKLSDYFPERIREQMKTPGSEFALQRAADETWQVLPVDYGPQKYVAGVDGKQNVWTQENPHPAQPLRVCIQARPELAEYGDPANIVLLAPGAPLDLKTTGSGPGPSGGAHRAAGVAFELRPSPEMAPGELKSLEVTAANNGDRADGWGCVEVILDGARDLTGHRALGAWVEGDGSGAYLHFTLEDGGRWQVRDYYVRLDFTGWRYVKMPQWAKGEVYDFKFPFSHFIAIRGIDFASIARVYVFLTNVPVGGTATARFSRLEALEERPRAIRHPGLTVDDTSITFPVTLEPAWYLEYAGAGPVRVFDADGFTQAQAALPGPVPSLKSGKNTLTFFCERGADAGETVEVTVNARGSPLR